MNNTLDGNTEAQFIGARVTGGYDFPLGGLRTGPIAGLDYARYRINAFDDKGNLRTGVRYEKQDVDSLEASVGWRVRGNVEFSNTMSLQPYATVAWVRELADGLDSSFTIKDHVDGANRRIAVREQDKNFGKATVGLQWLAAENLNLYSKLAAVSVIGMAIKRATAWACSGSSKFVAVKTGSEMTRSGFKRAGYCTARFEPSL